MITSGSWDGTVCIGKLQSYEKLLEDASEEIASSQGKIGNAKFLYTKYSASVKDAAVATTDIAAFIPGHYVMSSKS